MAKEPTSTELEAAVERMKASVPASFIRATIFGLVLGAATYFNRDQKDLGVDWWGIIALIAFLWAIIFGAGVFFAGAPPRKN